MFSTRRREAAGSSFALGLVLLVGLFAIVITTYLLINPASLPSQWYLPLAARFVPTVLVGVFSLLLPLFSLAFALLLMLGGSPLLESARPLFPLSPFWTLLGMTVPGLVIQNLRRNNALPWGIMLAMLSIMALAALYELQSFSRSTQGVLFPLFAGFMLVTALGMLQTAKQITFVVSALIIAFLALELQLLPFLIPSWGTLGGILRQTTQVSSLRQVTSLDWLLSAVALLCLGMAAQSTGRWRLLLLGLFLVFATSSLLTFTRGSFIALGAGVSGLLILGNTRQSRRLGWTVSAGLLLFLIARYSGAWTYSVELRGLDMELERLQAGEPGRLAVLLEGIRAMPSHLFVGQGAMGTAAHSSFLDVWNNYGGVTAVLLWGFVLFLFRRSFVLARAATSAQTAPKVKALALGLYCSFAGMVATSLVEPSFFNLTFSVVFWLLRGLELAIWRSGLAPLPQPKSDRRRRLVAPTPMASLPQKTPDGDAPA
ncbi:MAG: hypothetical protein HY680_00490 [Chloroflexi bacterium]|nr:hypothetical protein [Chloroflexota bacterium]